MKISEFIQKLDDAQREIDAQATRRLLQAGSDVAAMVVLRVTHDGKNSDGAPFSPYSTVPLPAFFYFGKSRTTSADRTIRSKAKAKELVSYSDFRRINNLRSDKKIFEFTGAMWRSFRPLSVQVVSGLHRVTIGAANEKEGQKMEWLSQQEGRNILQPTAEEIRISKESIQDWINNIVNG